MRDKIKEIITEIADNPNDDNYHHLIFILSSIKMLLGEEDFNQTLNIISELEEYNENIRTN